MAELGLQDVPFLDWGCLNTLVKRESHTVFLFSQSQCSAAVWYENLSVVVIRPDKSRHKHQWC